MKKIINNLILVFIIYPIAIILGIIFELLRSLKKIKVNNYKNIPHKQQLIVVSNHPSLIEPILIPFLFFRSFIFNPFKIPRIVADKKNYYDPWYFKCIRQLLIIVDRKDKTKGIKTLKEMIESLKKGKTIIVFPEGGRTFKGTEFSYSREGNRIRKIKRGISYLVKTGVPVLPIWIEIKSQKNLGKLEAFWIGNWKKIKINIGTIIAFEKNTNNIEEKIEKELLNLS